MPKKPSYTELVQRIKELEQQKCLDGSFADEIAERKETEQKLRESEVKIRNIMDNVEVGIALISPTMEILELNNRTRKWFPNVDMGQQPTCYHALHDPPREALCDGCPTAMTMQDGSFFLNAMAGREVRMAELNKRISSYCKRN
jgi:PAS domain-containing protein